MFRKPARDHSHAALTLLLYRDVGYKEIAIYLF
jgi:hypothetical protein